MNEKFLNLTGLSYYHSKLENEFASQTDFDTLEDKVDDIIAEGGEPNVIESISVNGTPQTITNKNVDLPAIYTQAQIEGFAGDVIDDSIADTATTSVASKGYVDTNGGKIDSISVNGTPQTIDANKNVDLSVASLTKSSNTYTIAEGQESLAITVNSTSGSEAVSVGGVSVALASDIPTKVSDLTNDSGFITNTVNNLTNYYTKSETYTKSEVDAAIGAITSLNLEVVQTLPTQDISQTTIYLVPKSTAQTNNTYDEYINTTGTTAGWELIGSTDIDLSNYWNSTNLVAITTSEIDTIVSGS